MAIARILFSLNDSLSQPQIKSRLELYQTNLVLQVSEFKSDVTEDVDIAKAIDSLVGNSPYEAAIKQYQKAGNEAKVSRDNFQVQLQQLASIETAQSRTSNLQPIADTETVTIISPQEQLIKNQII